MITVEKVKGLVEEKIGGTEAFIVDIAVSAGNKILVEIDSQKGVNITECTVVHRFIESMLDRNIEDYDLTVSSPGLEEPFKIFRQYRKNMGKNVRVVLKTGTAIEGELTDTNDMQVEITSRSKEKVNGKKQIISKKTSVAFDQIKSTRLILNL